MKFDYFLHFDLGTLTNVGKRGQYACVHNDKEGT